MATTNCPACSGPGQLLGALGHTKHFRCRDCGFTFSKTPKSRRPVSRPATEEEKSFYHARAALAAGRVRFVVEEPLFIGNRHY